VRTNYAQTLVIIDDDLQCQPEEIPTLAVAERKHVVIGRINKGESSIIGGAILVRR
jgi:hypothetical protein